MQGLPEEGTPERTWLNARASAVRRLVDVAPGPWRSWARTELTRSGIGEVLANTESGAAAGGDWDKVRGRALRATLGQVFTPPRLARLLADVLDLRRDRSVLDPACGAGSLLVAVCDLRREAGLSVAETLEAVEGWDRDPVAAWLCRARLVEWALERPDEDPPGVLRVHCVDALSGVGRPQEVGRVGVVIGNPPYLEAKRMRRAEPGLKERLRERFPQLKGAFDLYLAFCWLALDLVEDGGEVALLVPNKVCQGRYASGFRERLLAPEPPALLRLVDLSRMKPRPFPGTGVYPVVLHLSSGPATEPVRVRRVSSPDQLDSRDWQSVPRSALRAVGGEYPIFAPFKDTWADLEPLFAGQRLGQVAKLVSTCSFHAKGLREQFVSAERPGELAHRYLGLHSRTRRTEVSPFRVDWDGGWIRYDQDELRQVHRNPLPDLERTFTRPKLIWCQHALRMRAVADPEGRWVTKDTYPVGWPTDPGWSLSRLLAVLNSTVLTALYNTVYQGIVVGGETYHYLPAFLRHVPIPDPKHPSMADVDALADALAGEGPVDGELWLTLDRAVAEAYGVSEGARQRMVDTHLARVGAEVPG